MEKVVKQLGQILPTLQAVFKPLSKIAACFDCDAHRTVLIDDSPYKGCTSPDNNCIYPAKFDEEKMVDNILIDELLPYILQLDEREDVREIISSNRYGQPPISNTNEYRGEAAFWKERNLYWSRKTFYTDRLPLVEKIQKFVSGREEIKNIMAEVPASFSSMKGPQMISLARKLGSTTAQLKGANARAFINKVLNEYNLLKWD